MCTCVCLTISACRHVTNLWHCRLSVRLSVLPIDASWAKDICDWALRSVAAASEHTVWVVSSAPVCGVAGRGGDASGVRGGHAGPHAALPRGGGGGGGGPPAARGCGRSRCCCAGEARRAALSVRSRPHSPPAHNLPSPSEFATRPRAEVRPMRPPRRGATHTRAVK